ncbi:CAP domain-containing protein [Methanospirillum sp.]
MNSDDHVMRRFSFFVFCLFCIACTQIPVTAVSIGPDLIITDLTGKNSAYTGYPYEGTISIENRGDQTSGITTVYVFLRDAADPEINGTISAIPVDPIRSGQVVNLSYIGTVPDDLPQGEYSLYGYIQHRGSRVIENTKALARLSTPVTVIEKPVPDQKALESGIIAGIQDLTNEYRIRQGLHPLSWDDDLAIITDRYAEELSRTGRLSHTDRSGDGPSDRAEAFGYPTTKEIVGGVRIGISENLAYIGTGMVSGVGYVDPTNSSAIATALMDGWMNSPGHKKNILDPLSDRFGIGLFWNGEYYYAVSDFW